MGWTSGTASRNAIPLKLRFRYNGADISWSQPIMINGFSNYAESIDGRYRISDLDVSFADPNGSYFATQFGRGTIGFGSNLEVIAYLGGTQELAVHGLATSITYLGTTGAQAATLHTGKIFGISYSNRSLRIRSKTNLSLVGDLKWQFPVARFPYSFSSGGNYVIGSMAFMATYLGTSVYGSQSFYDHDDGNSRWKFNAYTLGTLVDGDGDLTALYPAMDGRGTVPIDSSYYWPGTQSSSGTNFYDEYEMQKGDGTYFGTLNGTITSESDANSYGYFTLNEAEVARASGTRYIINKTRLKFQGTDFGAQVYFCTKMRISGSPNDCYKLLMTGAMVTPYFGTADLDTTTLNASGTTTAFSFFDNTIDFEENKVSEALKEIVTVTQGLFSVNASNRFEYRAYGPKNLRDTIPSFGTSQIMQSEFDNNEDDYFNRFIIKYGYNFVSEKYSRQADRKAVGWSKSFDRPLIIESKWIKNPNEAESLADRLRVRYQYTIPRISFTTNLNHVGLDIGTLLNITDVNSGISGKIVQVVGFDKDWTEKTITFDCLDGESLFQRKGFSYWGTTGTLPGDTVSNSSISGWGTAGTVANINGSLYGSQFSWW
jgi:hypothetical protein